MSLLASLSFPHRRIALPNDRDYLSCIHFMGYKYRPIDLDGKYGHFIVRHILIHRFLIVRILFIL